jgi:hypothetical protein
MADLNVVAGTVSALVRVLLEKGILDGEDVEGLLRDARARASEHVRAEFERARMDVAKKPGLVSAAAGMAN